MPQSNIYKYNVNYKYLYQSKREKLRVTSSKLFLSIQRNKALRHKILETDDILSSLALELQLKDNIINELNYKVNELLRKINGDMQEKLQPSVIVRNDNLDKYIARNTCITKINMEDGFVLFCNECVKNHQNNKTIKALTNRLEFQGAEARNLENGKNKIWYNFKKTLELHIKSHSNKDAQIEVTRNLFALCLSLCKLKGAWCSYEQLLGTTHCMQVNIGQTCHGRSNMPKMIRTLRCITLNKLREFLLTPNSLTGFLPHFSITFDKATVNKVTTQALMLIIAVDGSRLAFPIDCSPVYNLNDVGKVGGGKTRDLTNMIKDGLLEKLGLGLENMNQLTAIYADGQYGESFHSNLKMILGLENNSMMLSIWDTAHWLDLAVKQSGQIEFFQRFIARSNKFTTLFGQGKGREEFRGAAKVLGMKALEQSNFSVTRFSSSCLSVLKTLHKNYPALIKAYRDSQDLTAPFSEMQYYVKNKDILMDICAIIDILTPIGQLMEIVQSTNTTPWKICRYCPRLLAILTEMENELYSLINGTQRFPQADLFPVLLDKWKELNPRESKETLLTFYTQIYENESVFKYEELDPIEAEFECKTEVVGEFSRQKRKYQEPVIKSEPTNSSWMKKTENNKVSIKKVNFQNGDIDEWKTRNTIQCLKEYLNFCEVLKNELKIRFSTAVGEKVVQLSKCFDMTYMLDAVAELQFCTGEDFDKRLNNYFIDGTYEFHNVYNNLMQLPQFRDYLQPDKASDIYKCWKKCFYDLIWQYSHNGGSWFINSKNELLVFNSPLKSICKVYNQAKIDSCYKIELSDNTIVDNVRFREEKMIKFICTSPVLQNNETVPRELLVILDFIFSTCGTEACVEGFFSVMKNHKRSGGQSSENLVDSTIIDFIFPEPLLCWDFLKHAAEQYIMGNEELGLFAHREPLLKHKSKKEWNVSKVMDRRLTSEVKFPFLFTFEDQKKLK